MADRSDEARARAEAKFEAASKKRADADAVHSEHRKQHEAVLDRTAKLKALRLAKEAADKAGKK
jgi:hypothetical protein